MSNTNDLNNLNRLVGEIKILVGSILILDKSLASKDEIATATALDAINFRVREIAKISQNFKDLSFPIDEVLVELSMPKPNIKTLHNLLDSQLETLRKMALSEILTLSIE